MKIKTIISIKREVIKSFFIEKVLPTIWKKQPKEKFKVFNIYPIKEFI